MAAEDVRGRIVRVTRPRRLVVSTSGSLAPRTPARVIQNSRDFPQGQASRAPPLGHEEGDDSSTMTL